MIANTKYCTDINYDKEYTFSAYSKIIINNIPTFNCLGTVISNHIGIPTLDEVIFARAITSKNNTDYYLNINGNENMWYTMSGAKGSEEYLNMFLMGVLIFL